MEPLGLAVGVVGLASRLFSASMECYDILSDAKNFGADHDNFVWQLTTERHRLMRWEKFWGVGSGTLNQKLDPSDYRYRYAVGTLARIISLFASAEGLSTKYGIRATTGTSISNTQVSTRDQGGGQREHIDRIYKKLHIPGSWFRKGVLKNSSGATGVVDSSPSNIITQGLGAVAAGVLENPVMLENQDLVPGLSEEIVRIKETTTRLQQILPSYKKLQWAIADKQKSSQLIEELKKYNDGLFRVLPTPGLSQILPPTSLLFLKFNVPVQLPVQRNKRFSGREDLLERIHGILEPTQSSKKERRTAVIYGLGGMGKSQISIEYAYRYSSSYTSVFWADATSRATLAQSTLSMAEQLISHYATKWGDSIPDFTQIGTMLGIHGLIDSTGRIKRDEDSLDLAAKAMNKWLLSTGNDEWLIIFDNHDDTESVKLLEFFPVCDFGSIIITTRRPEVRHLGIGVEVGEIDKKAGISILLSSAFKNSHITDTDYIEASKIAEKLGYLPLALDQAGGYVSAMQIPLSRYIPLYTTNFKRVASATNHPGISERYRNDTLFTTWKISFDSLPDPASDLLLLCAFLATGNQDVPEELFYRGKSKILWLEKDDELLHDALQPLLSFSLAKRKNDAKSFYFHPLVLEWAREGLEKKRRQKRVEKALILFAESINYSGSTVKTMADYDFERRILIHVDISVNNIRQYLLVKDSSTILDREVADTIALIGIFLHTHGRVKDAEELVQSALTTHREATHNEEPDIHTPARLQAMYCLALISYRKTDYKEALELFEQVLAVRGRILGDKHQSTLDTIRSIASIRSTQGCFQEAQKMHERALAGQEEVLGREHPDTLRTVSGMASNFHIQRRYQEAADLYKRALAGYEKVLGEEHPDTLRTVGNLALNFDKQLQHQEAADFYKRALAGYEKVLGEEHPDTLRTVSNLALNFDKQLQYQEAADLHKRALAGYEKVLGEEHPDTLRTVGNLALNFDKQLQYQEAAGLYRRELAGYEKVLGEEHPDTLCIVTSIANSFYIQRQYQEAAYLYKRALAGYEKVLGEEHLDTLRIVSNLALNFDKQLQYQEAADLYKRALAGYEKVLGKEHPDTLRIVSNLALNFSKQLQHQEAAGLYKRALAGYEKVLGKEHPDTLHVIHNMGVNSRVRDSTMKLQIGTGGHWPSMRRYLGQATHR